MDTINISLSEDTADIFPRKDNVGLIKILNNDKVMLSLSRNAMLGLGQQLIKLAHFNYEDGYHVHIDPCERNYLPQALGFFSHPESAEFILCCSDFEGIDELIK